MKAGTVAVGFLDPGKWSYSFGQSLIDLYLGDLCGAQRMVPRGVQLRNFCGTGGIVAGRNEIAEQFLDATECEWLFVVDSDMGFAADTVDRLIDAAHKYDRPVMGGLCFGLRRAATDELHVTRFVTVPTIYDFVETDDAVGFRSIIEYPRNEVVKVSATGSACMLVHRRALHKVRERYGPSWYDPITHPKGTTFSEDLSFCVRLAACDIPLHCHTGVKTSHYKGGIYLDEAAFDAQRIDDEQEG